VSVSENGELVARHPSIFLLLLHQKDEQPQKELDEIWKSLAQLLVTECSELDGFHFIL
jgi:hypothetical protein